MAQELLADRYELVSSVGKGATGQVWRASDTLLKRAVAVKMVDLEGAKDPAMAQRFRREGIAIAGLNNQSIVKVFDTGTTEDSGWLVMELLAGPNFNALVRDHGPVTYAAGLPLLAQVADGLQAAHDAGITHRDVKPANIVLDAPPAADGTLPDLMSNPQNGRPVLVDFGIAQIVDEAGTQLTRPATAIGTAAYMSPEQARGQNAGPASDVYSLACVAYHLLLGRPPFTATSSLAVAHSQAFDTPPSLLELAPDAPPALDALLRSMLAKNPDERPSAHEVAVEMRAIAADPTMQSTLQIDAVAGENIGAAARRGIADTTESVADKGRRANPTLIAAIVLLVLVAAALAWTLVNGDRGNSEPVASTPASTIVSSVFSTHTVEVSQPETVAPITAVETSIYTAQQTVTADPTTATTVHQPTTVHATTTVVQTATAVTTTTVTQQVEPSAVDTAP